MTISDFDIFFLSKVTILLQPPVVSRSSLRRPGGVENPGASMAPGFPRKGLERREVEKRIYGVERERLTASATFLVLPYLWVLNRQ